MMKTGYFFKLQNLVSGNSFSCFSCFFYKTVFDSSSTLFLVSLTTVSQICDGFNILSEAFCHPSGWRWWIQDEHSHVSSPLIRRESIPLFWGDFLTCFAGKRRRWWGYAHCSLSPLEAWQCLPSVSWIQLSCCKNHEGVPWVSTKWRRLWRKRYTWVV